MAVNGKVTWFEITTDNMSRARDFYQGLFGWETRGDPDVYLHFPAGGDRAIGGGLMPARGAQPYATFCVEVDDVDAAYEAAIKLGATAVVGPTANPGGVRSAYLRDPDGSIFSVYRFMMPPP